MSYENKTKQKKKKNLQKYERAHKYMESSGKVKSPVSRQPRKKRMKKNQNKIRYA